jgi:hypothetical protein
MYVPTVSLDADSVPFGISGVELNYYSGLVITPQAMRGGAPLEAPAETA